MDGRGRLGIGKVKILVHRHSESRCFVFTIPNRDMSHDREFIIMMKEANREATHFAGHGGYATLHAWPRSARKIRPCQHFKVGRLAVVV